jgi:mycothiol synthase
MAAGPQLRSRAAAADTERDRMQALVARFPDRHIHVIDAMYRLTSPTVGDASGAQVWEDAAGDLVGFGVWQPAFKMFDYGFDPRAGARRMADTILDWAVDWFARRASNNGPAETCWIKVLQQNVEWREAIEARSFTRCAWSIAHLEALLDGPVSRPELPEGFQIRLVAGEDEADAWADLHRAVFPRVGMTRQWRLGMIGSPTYRPDLDLVVTAPDGALTAFCEGWVGGVASQPVGQIEPFGTHPAYRGNRLGRAVLLALMQRMRAAEVRRVFGEPWNDNSRALHSYQSLGFAETFSIPTYAREFR